MRSPIPDLRGVVARIRGRVTGRVPLKYGFYACGDATLYTVHDAGLGSCLTVTLHNLLELGAAHILPARISFRQTMLAFKDGDPGEDIYPQLFSPAEHRLSPGDVLAPSNPRARPRLDASGRYADYPHALYSPLVQHYFSPSPAVTQLLEALIAKYSIRLDDLLCVCIRGTDKFVEVRPIDSALYIRRVETLLDQRPIRRVLIQTDQEQIARVFCRYFGDRCFRLSELPTTTGALAMHLTSAIDGRRLAFAKTVLAIILLMSKAGHVLTHTGNVGAWVSLYRGQRDGLFQMRAGEEFS
jgi:hypothetical protein